MALARTHQLNHAAGGGFGTGSSTTASFTPPSASLLAIPLYVMEDSGSSDPTGDLTIVDSIDGATGWTKSVAIGSADSWAIGVCIFTKPIVTGASMTVSFDAGARNIYGYFASVEAFTGYGAVGATGSDKTDSGASALNMTGADTLTLGGPPPSTSIILGIIGFDPSGTVTGSVAANNTQIVALDDFGAGCVTSIRDYGSSAAFGWADTTPGFTSSRGVACAIEITEAGGGGPDPDVPILNPFRLITSSIYRR